MAYMRFRWYRRFLPACDAWLTVAEDLDTGELWFPIRPLCLILGVDSPSQVERIKGSWRLAPALHQISIPADQRHDGTWSNVQQTSCLPFDEFAWWMGDIDPRGATPRIREKLLRRQRALMALARELQRADDAGVEELARRISSDDGAAPRAGAATAAATVATGEIHLHCPRCHTPICVVINGAHVVPGVEVGE